MPASISLRVWLSWSRSKANSRAFSISSASKSSTPIDILSKRPAAFKRGPIQKPRSLEVNCSTLRLATSANATIPGRQRRARIRIKP